MSAVVSLLTAPAPSPPAPRQPSPPGRARPPQLARRVALRLHDEWLPRTAWTLGRAGRPGLVGMALLLASGTFLLSTHFQVAAEVDALRADLAAARSRPRRAPSDDSTPAAAPMRALPARNDVAAMLRQLFATAAQARLAVDTGKYEVKSTRNGGLVRYQIAFPVSGPYPRIRAFLDATLARMPALAVTDLALERRSIGDADVEARLGMTVYTREGGARPAATPGPGAVPDLDRVVAPTHDGALFAQHSWYVAPPPPPPAAPPPPPPPVQPTAPPLPYAFLGRFAPGGDPPVFFLARGDRVLQVGVGDTIDGVYRLESATAAQLVFLYLPLDVRQLLQAGGSR